MKASSSLLQLGLAHLSVADNDAALRHQLLDLRRELVDGFDAVVDEVDLAAALQLQLDRRADQLLVELGHHRLDGHAVLGRRLDHAHIAQANERHMQCARDRRGRHGEHVDLLAKLLQPFFVAHTETLFFIDHQQAEVLELQVLREQAMRADQDVDLSGLEFFQDQLLLLRRAEARDHLDVDGELRKAPA